MSCDKCNGKELERPPLSPTIIRVIRGFCPSCSAKIECEISRTKHRGTLYVTHCETCGQKLIWNFRKIIREVRK